MNHQAACCLSNYAQVLTDRPRTFFRSRNSYVQIRKENSTATPACFVRISTITTNSPQCRSLQQVTAYSLTRKPYIESANQGRAPPNKQRLFENIFALMPSPGIALWKQYVLTSQRCL